MEDLFPKGKSDAWSFLSGHETLSVSTGRVSGPPLT